MRKKIFKKINGGKRERGIDGGKRGRRFPSKIRFKELKKRRHAHLSIFKERVFLND